MDETFARGAQILTGIGLAAAGWYSLYYGSPHVAALLVVVGASNFWIGIGAK